MCSVRIGSCPTRIALKCSIAPMTASSRPVIPVSPTPEIPSSVSTVTNKKLRLPPQTACACTSVIFIVMTTPFHPAPLAT